MAQYIMQKDITKPTKFSTSNKQDSVLQPRLNLTTTPAINRIQQFMFTKQKTRRPQRGHGKVYLKTDEPQIIG